MSRAGKSRTQLRVSPGQKSEGSSPAAITPANGRTSRIPVWIEFSESDIAAEKWDASGTKGKEKGKGGLFEDPDGLVELPPSLITSISSWKRPSDLVSEQTPVVVDPEAVGDRELDLLSPNKHILTSSELMRWIVCQVTALWQLHNTEMNGKIAEGWNPWDLIYPKAKSTGLPSYNSSGKYAVKLFWMGTWRKLIVDDQIPVTRREKLLLPVSQLREMWLPILCKAILKVAAIDYHTNLNPYAEFGECNIVHLLTGWLPEPIPIRSGHGDSIWRLMKSHLPKWTPAPMPGEKNVEEPESLPETAVPPPGPPATGKSKPTGKGDSHKVDTTVQFKREEYPLVIFASYIDKTRDSSNQSAIQEQSSTDLSLTKAGLPLALPHAVLVTQTRQEPLECPRPPDPDSLLPKFSYLGFKSRKRREEEANQIAKELAAIDSELVEVTSPLLHLSTDSARKKGNSADLRMHKGKMWMKYDDFVDCFTTLYVFHKPGGYEFKRALQDMKMTMTSSNSKKLSGSTLTDAGSSYNSHATATQLGVGGITSYLMCVDSIKPIEIIINLSVLPRWPYRTTSSYAKAKSKTSVTSIKESESNTSCNGESDTSVTPGLVIIEEYRWDSLITGQPLLKIKTTGTKAAALCLSPGRHLVRMTASAPIGYHLEFWSLTKMLLDEEDGVLSELTKESLRYETHATSVFTTLSSAVKMFEEPELYRELFYNQGLSHRGRDLGAHHCRVLYWSLLRTLAVHLGDDFTKDVLFAWKAFAQEGFRLFLRGLEKGLPTCQSQFHELKLNDMKGFRKPSDKPVPENWIDRESTEEETKACIKIQAAYRGYWQRKVWKAITKETEEHRKASQLLNDSLGLLLPNEEKVSLYLFNTLFKMDARLLSKFPFQDDEWSRVSFEDHEGHYKEQPANSWFIMFREAFFVPKHGMLVVPHLYTAVQTCSLRVVNNDTGEEIPRSWQRVVPHVYVRNKRGYTFVAEGRTTDEPIPAGRCRLRLLGTDDALLGPKEEGTVNCQFFTENLREYYLPNPQYIFFRLAVTVNEDVQISLHVEASKPSAYIKVQIFDTIDGKEKSMASSEGKCHAVIPAFTFLKNVSVEGDDPVEASSGHEDMNRLPVTVADEYLEPPSTSVVSRAPSRASSKASSRAVSRQSGSSKQAVVEDAHDGDFMERDNETACGLYCPSFCCLDLPEPENHKYIIQGAVLRDSWDVKESAWPFISWQKAEEERRESIETASQLAGRLQSAAHGKRNKSGNKAGGKSKSTKAPAQLLNSKPSIDPSVPHWTMNIVTLEEQKDLIELKKDTQREEEIKAMKKAWEEAEPGRAEKAKDARKRFLDRRLIQSVPEASQTGEKSVADVDVPPKLGVTALKSGSRVTIELQPSTPASYSPSTSPVPDLSGFVTRCPIHQQDLSQFVRQPADGHRVVLDEKEMHVRRERREEEVKRYRRQRERVIGARESDRQARNQMKTLQLEVAEQRQASVDEARNRINQMREAYRKRVVEEQTREMNELLAARSGSDATLDELAGKGKKTATSSKKAPKK